MSENYEIVGTTPSIATKFCKGCNEDRPISAFGPCNRRGRPGLMSECRECKKGRDRKAAAPGTERRQKLAQDKSQRRTVNKDSVNGLRATLHCTLCGVSGEDAQLLLGSDTDLNMMIDGGYSLERVMAEAREHDPYCQKCFPNRLN